MKMPLYIAAVASWTLLLSHGAMAGSPTDPNVVNVVAKEFSYEMPESIPAGPTLFHFTNAGEQLHQHALEKRT